MLTSHVHVDGCQRFALHLSLKKKKKKGGKWPEHAKEEENNVLTLMNDLLSTVRIWVFAGARGSSIYHKV
jgi:hypothetical protein